MADPVFSLTSRLFFGQDAFRGALSSAGFSGTRGAVITEAVLKQDRLVESLRETLAELKIETITYDDISHGGGAPGRDQAEDAAAFVGSGRVKLVIGFGGIGTISVARYAAHGLPFIAVPTTFRNPFLFSRTVWLPAPGGTESVRQVHLPAPEAVAVDPSYSRTLPPRYSGAAVMAAVLDAAEGLASGSVSSLAENLLLSAVSELLSAFPSVLSEPDDPRVRERLSAGGLLAALGLGRNGPCTAVALSAVLSARFGVPKSWSCALLLPYYLERLAGTDPALCAKFAALLGEKIDHLTTADAAALAPIAARDFLGRIEMPFRLGSFGIGRDELEAAAAEASRLSSAAWWCRGPAADELLAILREAY
jgi:alcohol dehydrogenase class IV